MKTLLIALCALIALSAQAIEPREFAWLWTLQPADEGPAFRVRLSPDVYAGLTRSDLQDLTIADANDQPVPFSIIPPEYLIEPLAQRLPLEFESALVAVDNGDANGPDDRRLELTLQHGETRLILTTPQDAATTMGDQQLVFEALIGAVEPPPEMSDHSLVLRFSADAPAALDCRLREADDVEARERSIRLSSEGDSHPYRYTAVVPIRHLPGAWYLRCFGSRNPPGFELNRAHLYVRGELDHAQRHRLEPELAADNGYFLFELSGPYRVRSIEVAATTPNLLADIRVDSRMADDQPWRARGEGVLSTLPSEDAGPAIIEVQPAQRHRQWRIRTTPPLSQAPDISVVVEAEEFVFLAQGEGPWRLYAGSHAAASRTVPQNLVAETRQRLGNAWTWPVADSGERLESGGASALVPPRDPVPWQRLLLWSVLVAGALLLVWLSVRLLRQGGE